MRLKIHQSELIIRKRTVSLRIFRTMSRLYGVIETASSSVGISLVRSFCSDGLCEFDPLTEPESRDLAMVEVVEDSLR